MTIKTGEHISPKTEYKTFYPITDNETKICTKCLQEKNLDRFGQSKNGKYKCTCKDCDNLRQRNFRKINPTSCRNATKVYREKDVVYWRLYNRCKQKNITIKQYLEIFRTHNGKCDICGTSHLELNKSLGIDHNHKTGKIRGLLCNSCNIALGSFRDNPEILEKAIEYLKKNQ